MQSKEVLLRLVIIAGDIHNSGTSTVIVISLILCLLSIATTSKIPLLFVERKSLGTAFILAWHALVRPAAEEFREYGALLGRMPGR